MYSGVICSSICISESTFQKRFAEYKACLSRGLVLNAEFLKNTVDIELIYEGVKYTLLSSRVGPTLYLLELNGSYLEAKVHRLSDGGLLISTENNSYTAYMREDIDRHRYVVVVVVIVVIVLLRIILIILFIIIIIIYYCCIDLLLMERPSSS